MSGCELLDGDRIEDRYKEVSVHRGRITERMPGHGLFWIMDEITGGRRLLIGPNAAYSGTDRVGRGIGSGLPLGEPGPCTP